MLRAFKAWDADLSLYAIEKSPIHISGLVEFATVIGTDFHEQNFLDKKASIVFCNPPYSEYEDWAEKIIKSMSPTATYLVIPDRWQKSQRIADAVKFAGAQIEVVGSFDFSDADRKARAKVHLLCVWDADSSDALFDKFFQSQFAHLTASTEDAKRKEQDVREEATEFKTSLVKRSGLVPALVQLYDLEMARIRDTFEKVASLDMTVMREIFEGATIKGISDKLHERLGALRENYWRELFSNMTEITRRLTRKNRENMLNRLEKTSAVDFTAGNIYAVLTWILSMANAYVDSQIVEVFNDMISDANIVLYKSNQRVFGKGEWRYCNAPRDLSHFALDYRIVIHRGGMRKVSYGKGACLTEYAASFMSDLLTVANLLGFPCDPSDVRLLETYTCSESAYWKPGKPQIFANDTETIFEARAHLNGNIHLRMSQRLALALNVAMGKLQGWIRSKEEAVAELGDPEAAVWFEKSHRLTANSLPALGYSATA